MVYQKDICYLFYGKPAYVVRKGDDHPSKVIGDAAICFVLNLANCPDLYRIFAFDTGAFFGKRYDEYMPRGVSIDDFELSADRCNAAKIVGAFFGTNEGYYDGNTRHDIPISNLDFVSQTLVNMARSTISDSFDERCCSVELQFDCDIKLAPGVLQTIVMPTVIAGEHEVREACTTRWNIRPVGYRLKRSPASARTDVIFERLGQYYTQEGLL